LLALCSFGAIIISFQSLEVSKEERRLGAGLVPENCTENQYIDLLIDAVIKRESILRRMTSSIGFGVLEASAILILGFVGSSLPNSIYLSDDLIHQLLYSTTIFMIFLFAAVSAIMFFKWIEIKPFGELE